jgi:cold shock CspA family protein
VNEHSGTVTAFDSHRGTGVVVDEAGAEFPFHCTAIANGTREIEPGTAVRFDVAPGLGRWEADNMVASSFPRRGDEPRFPR